MFVACGIWCLADVSSVSPSSEQSLAHAEKQFFSKLVFEVSAQLTVQFVHMGQGSYSKTCSVSQRPSHALREMNSLWHHGS